MNKRQLSFVLGATALIALATPALALTDYGSTIGQSNASNFSDPDAKFDSMSGDQIDSDSNLMQFGGSVANASATRSKLNASQDNDKDLGFSGFYIPDK